MSDVGLVKIYKKLGIPVPVKGLLREAQGHRPTRRMPLPALSATARDVSGPIPLSEQEAAMHAHVRDALQPTREAQSNISVPRRAHRPASARTGGTGALEEARRLGSPGGRAKHVARSARPAGHEERP